MRTRKILFKLNCYWNHQRDLKVIQGKFPKVLVRHSVKDTPVELPTAIEAIETDQEYYTMQEAQAQAKQTVDYWLKKANYLNTDTVSLVFALVANLILLILILFAIFGYEYRQKLATLIVAHSRIKPLKAFKIEGLYTTRAPATLIQPQEDDTMILRNVAWILMSTIILVLAGVIL